MNENFVITLAHVELLVVLDQERSFTETSRALGRSKLYAYLTTRRLEKNLGVKITQPAPRGLGRNIKFTRQGEAIVRDAHFAYSHLIKMMSHGSDKANENDNQ